MKRHTRSLPRRSTIALLVTVGTILSLATGAAAQGTRRQLEDEGATLRLASQTSWVAPAGEFVLRLQVAGVPVPADTALRVTVHRRVPSRSAFALTTTGGRLGGVLRTTTAPLDQLLPTDAGGAITYRLRPEELNLATSGVYPVEVELRDRGGGVADRLVTHLVYLARPPDGPKLGVSWIVAFHAEPSTGADGRRLPGPGPGLRALADVWQAPSYAALPLVLAPTPETIAALSATRQPVARETLDALRTGAQGRQVLTRTWVPIDVRALTSSGLAAEVAAQRARGLEALTAAFGSGSTRTGSRYWLAEEKLDEASLAHLRELGVDRAIVPEDDLQPVRFQVTLAQPFKLTARTGRPMAAAMADAGLASHFRTGGDPLLAAHQLLADLSVVWLDAPQRKRAVVVATPRDWRPSRSFLDTALAGLRDSPILDAIPLDAIFDGVDPARRGRGPLLRDLAPSPRPVLGISATAIARVRNRIDALGATLPADSPTYDAVDRQLLTAESADLRARGRRDYVAGVAKRVDRLARDIVVPRSRTLTLTAREGEIPLTFLNRGRETMTVLVRLESDRLEFPGGTERRLELPPRNTTVRVTVRARTSGAFPLRISLISPRGGLGLASTRFTVRSTAASGVGIVLSSGAALFLLLWWGRHLARGRRARRLVPA